MEIQTQSRLEELDELVKDIAAYMSVQFNRHLVSPEEAMLIVIDLVRGVFANIAMVTKLTDQQIAQHRRIVLKKINDDLKHTRQRINLTEKEQEYKNGKRKNS